LNIVIDLIAVPKNMTLTVTKKLVQTDSDFDHPISTCQQSFIRPIFVGFEHGTDREARIKLVNTFALVLTAPKKSGSAFQTAHIEDHRKCLPTHPTSHSEGFIVRS